MKTGIIIVAAGRSVRLGGEQPKQYRMLGGKTVLERTLACFVSSPEIDAVQVVIHPDDLVSYNTVIEKIASETGKILPPVFGGETRQESVHAGLLTLTSNDIILVHDAARPFVSNELLKRALTVIQGKVAAIPGLLVTDTIKRVNTDGLVLETLPRETMRTIQTPQVFEREALLNAHNRARHAGFNAFTDDGALMEWAGYPVFIFDGATENIKLTYEIDFKISEHRLQEDKEMMISRTGIGYDVHVFTEGNHVWLGGIKIPHDQGILAHSDGDVVLHALTDAVLGAICDGDIGTHFPPSDAQWRGASSDQFLKFACDRVRQRGGIIDHMDCMLLCEAPRLSPHREEMRERIAEIAGISPSRVSIKATTMEKMGFIGRKEGLAAQAVASIRLPEDEV